MVRYWMFSLVVVTTALMACGDDGEGTAAPSSSSSSVTTGAGGSGGTGGMGTGGGQGGSGAMGGGGGGGAGGQGGGCTIKDVMLDPGFECKFLDVCPQAWEEQSTGQNDVICTITDCGDPGAIAFDGSAFAWFGGELGNLTASVSQTIVFPEDAMNIELQLNAPSCDTDSPGTLSLRVDSDELFSADVADYPACNSNVWVQQTLDATAYADGSEHVITIEATTAADGAVTSFLVDSVRLIVCE